MAFFKSSPKGMGAIEKKLPPAGAWKHYDKKRPSQKHARGGSGETVLSIRSLSLSYEREKIIDGLSLDIRSGDYVAIIGENGSGKSTLLSAVLGLKAPTSGKITLHGVSRKEIGVLPQQNPVQRDFPALVSEVVLSGCLGRYSNGPFMSRRARDIAFANMEKLGITSLSARSYRELSGGQQQRVLLARALCAARKMIILDEPTSGLDPKSTADINALVEHLNKGQDLTVLTVTHDVPCALRYATHILRINRSSVFYGTKEEYLELPEAKQYLREPRDERSAPYGEGGYRLEGKA